ncbi:MAG: TlyA family RNA methyltransferase [Cyanobacteria bacterium P01_D01_bin.105]
MAKQRLDTLLVEQGLCPSRQQAQRLIRAGEVKIDQTIFDKPGTLVPQNSKITLKQKPPFVSRGGEKLAKALKTFEIDPTGKICLDGGISTGGFTDCLLQAGAQQVYGVDVGYGQVAWKIRQDPRVVLKERTNIRHLTPEGLYGESKQKKDQNLTEKNTTNQTEHQTVEAKRPTLGVMDVSFISLTKVLPTFWTLLTSPREVVLLVKPQFEVGREKIGKNGVVRDAKDQAIAIFQVNQAASALGWRYRGLTWSDTVGPAGNIEYLLWLSELSSELAAAAPLAWPSLDALCDLTQAARKAL